MEAAEGLERIDGLEENAGRVKRGLETTGHGVAQFARELEIALQDPFLEDTENATRISSLSKRATDLSTKGELLVRRADRALALALGLEPRADAVLDAPTTTG